MAQSKSLPNLDDPSRELSDSLDKLRECTLKCERFEHGLGTDEDTTEFRSEMTIEIRSATVLCKTIKRAFNQSADANDTNIQSLQKKFVELHSRLKQCVSEIKEKSKQHAPNKEVPKMSVEKEKEQSLEQKDEEVVSDVSIEIERQSDHEIRQDFSDTEQKKSDCNILTNIIKEGFLEKKSKYLKSWRKRWVVLDKDDKGICLLTFKEKRKYKNPTEQICIDDNIEVAPKDGTENEFIVLNKLKKLQFRFKALDRKSRKEWIDILHFVPNIEDIKKNPLENDEENNVDNKDAVPNENDSNDLIEEIPETVENTLKMYDKSNRNVQDCLLLIQDLEHLRNGEHINSCKIISDFESCLNEKGFVSREQIDELKDVSIKLISFLFDQEL